MEFQKSDQHFKRKKKDVQLTVWIIKIHIILIFTLTLFPNDKRTTSATKSCKYYPT